VPADLDKLRTLCSEFERSLGKPEAVDLLERAVFVWGEIAEGSDARTITVARNIVRHLWATLSKAVQSFLNENENRYGYWDERYYYEKLLNALAETEAADDPLWSELLKKVGDRYSDFLESFL
jgi:hypothetical protein